MNSFCGVLAFAITASLVQAQQTGGKSQDSFPTDDDCGPPKLFSPAYDQCIDNFLRRQKEAIEKQNEEAEKRLKDLNDLLDSARSVDDWQKMQSSKGSDQVEGIVNRTKELNSKLNQNPISGEVTNTSLDTIGRVATQENNTLDDISRSLREVFTQKEQVDFELQINHYTQALVKDHIKEVTIERDASRTSAIHSAQTSRSTQPQHVQSSGRASTGFTTEEWDSIEQSLPKEIVRQDQQRKAEHDLQVQRERDAQAKRAHDAAVAAANAEYHRIDREETVDDCNADQPSHPENCGRSSQSSSDRIAR
jgi:hypothetical protein